MSLVGLSFRVLGFVRALLRDLLIKRTLSHERGMEILIREEVEHQERLEAAGTGHQRGEYCGLYNVYSYWAGGWACTSHPGFWVRFPNERNQGKQGATLC